MTYVVCLSGPERTRAVAEVGLEDARIPQLPSDHHARSFVRGLSPLASGQEPAEPQSFLTVAAENVDAAVSAVERAQGWVLRMHFNMPAAPKPDPIMATLAEMRDKIAQLEARPR